MRRTRQTTALTILLTLALALPACSLIGYVGYDRNDPPPRDVAAAYTDLEGRRTAVLVAVADGIRYGSGRATGALPVRPAELLTEAMHRALSSGLTAPDLVPLHRSLRLMADDPYWSLRPLGQLLETLDVERLVVVDVATFHLREPGSADLWRGRLDATVSVHAADAPDPDERVFSERVGVDFPPNSEFGVANSDAQTVQLALLKQFTLRGAGLFFDHKE